MVVTNAARVLRATAATELKPAAMIAALSTTLDESALKLAKPSSIVTAGSSVATGKSARLRKRPSPTSPPSVVTPSPARYVGNALGMAIPDVAESSPSDGSAGAPEGGTTIESGGRSRCVD